MKIPEHCAKWHKLWHLHFCTLPPFASAIERIFFNERKDFFNGSIFLDNGINKYPGLYSKELQPIIT
jgi:hypothetical protein